MSVVGIFETNDVLITLRHCQIVQLTCHKGSIDSFEVSLRARNKYIFHWYDCIRYVCFCEFTFAVYVCNSYMP